VSSSTQTVLRNILTSKLKLLLTE